MMFDQRADRETRAGAGGKLGRQDFQPPGIGEDDLDRGMDVRLLIGRLAPIDRPAVAEPQPVLPIVRHDVMMGRFLSEFLNKSLGRPRKSDLSIAP